MENLLKFFLLNLGKEKNERKACKKGKNPKSTEYFIKDIIASPPFSAAKSKKEFSCKGFQKNLPWNFLYCFWYADLNFRAKKAALSSSQPLSTWTKHTYPYFKFLVISLSHCKKTHIHTTLYSHNIIISDDLVIKYFPPRHCETKDVSK